MYQPACDFHFISYGMVLLLFFPPPRGQETKQELPSDLALPIFSVMQKASVCFSPVVEADFWKNEFVISAINPIEFSNFFQATEHNNQQGACMMAINGD